MTSRTRWPADTKSDRCHCDDELGRQAEDRAAHGHHGGPDQHRPAEAAPEDECPCDDRAGHAPDPDRGVEIAGRRLAGRQDVRRDDHRQHADPADDRVVDGAQHDQPRDRPPPQRHGRGDRIVRPALACVDCRCARRHCRNVRGRRQAPQDPGDDEERQRVDDKREVRPADGHEDAAEDRAHDEAQVVQAGIRAVGRTELSFVLDEVRDVRADRRVEERREAGRQDREADQRRDWAVGDEHERHRDHACGAREVCHEQHEPPVVAIGHVSGRNRQHDVRNHAHCAEQPQHDRIAGLAIDHDEQRDDVQPVADRADELAAEQPRQRPVAQDVAIGRQEAQVSALGISARTIRLSVPSS